MSQMPRTRKILLVAFAASVIFIGVLMFAGPPVQRFLFYPKPRVLPSVVNQPTAQLLVHLQTVLESNAPTVALSLQPGLSEAQISTLESKGGFRLSLDLRALYRWHNGMFTNATIGLLPGERFLPLDEIVHERAILRQQVDSSTLGQRAVFAVFAGHRKSWVHVLDDGSGDGYFYDPERLDSEGVVVQFENPIFSKYRLGQSLSTPLM